MPSYTVLEQCILDELERALSEYYSIERNDHRGTDDERASFEKAIADAKAVVHRRAIAREEAKCQCISTRNSPQPSVLSQSPIS